jgi:hypothetical protein
MGFLKSNFTEKNKDKFLDKLSLCKEGDYVELFNAFSDTIGVYKITKFDESSVHFVNKHGKTQVRSINGHCEKISF